jgi:hypothetical protein
VTFVREHMTTGLAPHLWMPLQFEVETTARGPFHHPGKPGVVKGVPPLSTTKT